jgi:hypothetical protein
MRLRTRYSAAISATYTFFPVMMQQYSLILKRYINVKTSNGNDDAVLVFWGNMPNFITKQLESVIKPTLEK